MIDGTFDGAVATAAVSSPFWLQYVNIYGQAGLVILGLILAALRIGKAAADLGNTISGKTIIRRFLARRG